MTRGNFGRIRTVITLEKKLLIALVVASLLGSASSAWADTVNWPFTSAGNYTVSDATKVEVADAVAKLIAVDQTDDDNTSTGFGGGTHNQTQWDGTDSCLELTATGQTNGSGDFISRVMDAGSTAAWDSISWIPQRPTGKELPNNAQSETAYKHGNANMTGNVLLMHMNEASGAIVDSSGQGNNGAYSGALYSQTGKLNTAIGFDGVDDYVSVSNTDSLNFAQGTWCVWIYWNTSGSYKYVFDHGYTGRFLLYSSSSAGRMQAWVTTTSGTNRPQLTAPISTGLWYHLAVTYNGTAATIYLNGAKRNADSTYSGDLRTTASNLYIGQYGGGGSYRWDGKMDEISIYNRSLSDQEILDIYKRGALRLKYQVRSGNTNPPTGNFIGPDGTTTDYYEWGTTNSTSVPSFDLTNVSDNQYFQYKAYFETDDSSYSPKLRSVIIGPTHYPGDNPTVQNNTWQTYDSLSSFSETLGAGNVGNVRYQISNDGTNWYYWNSSNWVAASGYTQTNTAVEVNTNCGQFDDDVSAGDFYFRAFLHSDAAAQQVELDQVALGYTSKTSVSVSDSTFTFGTNPLNAWLTPQTSIITNDGTVAEDFVGSISQFTDGANTWGISSSANGNDIIRAQWSTASETGPWTDISAYDTDFTIATNVAVNDSVTLWFRVETPTATSSYNEHYSTLTVTAQEY